MRTAFDWKRFGISMLEVEAVPQSCVQCMSPTHLSNPDFIAVIIFGQGRGICNFAHPSVISSISYSSVLLSALFLHCSSLFSSFTVSDQVSYPCKATGRSGVSQHHYRFSFVNKLEDIAFASVLDKLHIAVKYVYVFILILNACFEPIMNVLIITLHSIINKHSLFKTRTFKTANTKAHHWSQSLISYILNLMIQATNFQDICAVKSCVHT
jgi:hypothetical protein